MREAEKGASLHCLDCFAVIPIPEVGMLVPCEKCGALFCMKMPVTDESGRVKTWILTDVPEL